MKRLSYCIALLIVALVFTACPSSTTVPLAPKGKMKIDKTLLGHWEVVSSVDIENFTIENNDDYSYSITASMYDEMGEENTTEHLIGWIVKVNNMKFWVLQDFNNGELKEKYYLYQFEIKEGKMYAREIANMATVLSTLRNSDDYMKELLKASQDKAKFLSTDNIFKKSK